MKSNSLAKIIGFAKKSQAGLLALSAKDRRDVLESLADSILDNAKEILAANKKDRGIASKSGKSKSFVERLALDKGKIEAISISLKELAKLSDGLFEAIEESVRPSGIKIKKVRFPLGLIAIIYESRPNVTVDAFAMAWKSGNAVILKGGKEITQTNKFFTGLIKATLRKHRVNPDIVQDMSGSSEVQTRELMQDARIDCLIPRGGKNLIEFVNENAKVPVIITGASVVHTYVDKSANLELARSVILNAKTRRVSICNALDVLLVHKSAAKNLLALLAQDMAQKEVELRADTRSHQILEMLKYPKLKKAKPIDFDTEFLDNILAVKTVVNFEEAMDHIKKHSLGHSEAIVTASKKQAASFFRQIDAACLYWNTSTQFSDGGEFGLGGEIGISTQKLHARGPFAYRELTTYKYMVESKGLVRK